MQILFYKNKTRFIRTQQNLTYCINFDGILNLFYRKLNLNQLRVS